MQNALYTTDNIDAAQWHYQHQGMALANPQSH